MKKQCFFTILSLFIVAFQLQAQTKRALFIAIDIYQPQGEQVTAPNRGSAWQNLSGCVNDATEVKELVRAKFGFTNEANMVFIKNQEATRTRILQELNHLVDVSQKGDIVFIYYAGHGSQVTNSKSAEADKKDETMVPADAYKGVKDIRDKELATLFNKLVEKGVVLTVIYDSCHSGSIGRGGMDDNPPVKRFLQGDPADVKDGKVYPRPEEKGALILSAAQDEECAEEQKDEHGTPHGAFTIALMKTLQTLPPTTSVDIIFKSLRGILKFHGKVQEPVLAGTEQRKNGTLFGEDRSSMKNNETTVAIINQKTKDNIEIQGGWAIGIAKDIELTKLLDSTVKIKVVSVEGITKSTATLISGTLDKIKPGDIFKVSNWVASNDNALTFWIPTTTLSQETLINFSNKLKEEASKNNKITWVNDPKATVATHTIFFNNGWFMGEPSGKVQNLGNTEAAVIQAVKNIKTTASLFISLPVPQDVASYLKEQWQSFNLVKAAANSSAATYHVSGRVNENAIEYSYYLPKLTQKDNKYLGTLPVRTNYISYTNPQTCKDTLLDLSLKLGRIQTWLALSSPASGQSNFPFYLGVKKFKTKKAITGEGTLAVGDTLGFVLVKDKPNENNWDLEKRFIYVFSISQSGKMELIFPRNGSVENRLPVVDEKIADETQLGPKAAMVIDAANETDTYVMLTSDAPITNPSVLEGDAVLTRSVGGSWFDNIAQSGASTRAAFITPVNWSVNRVSIRTVEKITKKPIKK